eukprot:g11607.t1
MRLTLAAWGLLVALSILWGGAFFFAAVAVREVPPLTVALGRVGLAALALGAGLALVGRRLPLQPGVLRAFLVMGLVNNAIPFSLFFWAQTTIPSGLASILNATTPIFAMLVAHLALQDERMAPAKAAGAGLGAGGVALLLGPDLADGVDVGALGVLACLAAALSYGVAGAYGRRFARLGVPPATAAWGQLSASTLLLVPVVLLVDRPWTLPPPSTEALGAILLLALLSTALAYILYFKLLAAAGSVNALLVTLLIPVSAVLLGTLVLGERLALHHGAGFALIAAGLLAIDGRATALIRAGSPRAPARRRAHSPDGRRGP